MTTIRIQPFSDDQTNKNLLTDLIAFFRCQFQHHFGWLLIARSLRLNMRARATILRLH
jgi:hypothetical protein